MFFSALSSVEMYAEYEGNKQNGPCIGELSIVHCSVKGSLYLTWMIVRTSLSLTGVKHTILFAVESDEGLDHVFRTTTHDLYIYQNKTIGDFFRPENNQIDSEMHIRLDNENDFVEASCTASTTKTTKVSILGMFKMVIPSSVLLDFIYTRSLFL